MPTRVLIVEDAAGQGQQIVEALAGAGFEVSTVSRFAKALAALSDAAQGFEALVIEESIEGGKGLRLLRETRTKRGQLPVVVVTRDGNWCSYAEALGLGALAYLPYPINPARLVGALEHTLMPDAPAESKRRTSLEGGRTDE